MNLMFRKNFREGGKSSAVSSGATKLGKGNPNRNNNPKRSRDMSYGVSVDDVHYRTHLFFVPARVNSHNFNEGNIFSFLNLSNAILCINTQEIQLYVLI